MRSQTKLTLILATLAACADPPHADNPVVVLVHDGEPRPEYLDGARAWEPLGYRFHLASDEEVVLSGGQLAPECGRQWYDRGCRDCQLTIGIVVDPLLLERLGSDAAADREARAVLLDDRLLESDTEAASRYLQIAVAHEVGHIVLDTPLHTDGGIMGGASAEMREVDYQLACDTINTCVGPAE